MGCASFKRDLRGERFGRLVVVRFAGRVPVKSKPTRTRAHWECLCECGKTVVVNESNLKGGTTGSCGCKRKETTSKMATTHGMKNSRLYRIWSSMKSRCDDLTDPYYGGRGISYCETWKEFEKFKEDMEETYGEGLTLERVDGNLGYFKNNCKWITRAHQSRNRSMSVRNTSGVTGVSIKEVRGKKYYAVRWRDEGKEKSKHFSFERYGEEFGFLLACEYREQQIALLNLQGAGYSENHGK